MPPMYRSTVLLLLAALAVACSDRPVSLDRFETRAAYAIGQDVGGSLASTGVELDLDAFMQGLRDALAEREGRLTPEETMTAIQEFQMRAQESMMARQEALGAANRAEGEAWLAQNATREGVITTASGLQYRVITQGDGEVPGPEDRVRVHYRGTFINGEQFDSSYDRGEPAVFGVSQVIPGWTEALQLMAVGSKLELAIPSDLAYGPNGPPAIGPNRTLLFEVELLGIER